MLAKKTLRGVVLGLCIGSLVEVSAQARRSSGADLLEHSFFIYPNWQLLHLILKTLEFVGPVVEVDHEGGYVDPNGHS